MKRFLWFIYQISVMGIIWFGTIMSNAHPDLTKGSAGPIPVGQGFVFGIFAAWSTTVVLSAIFDGLVLLLRKLREFWARRQELCKVTSIYVARKLSRKPVSVPKVILHRLGPEEVSYDVLTRIDHPWS